LPMLRPPLQRRLGERRGLSETAPCVPQNDLMLLTRSAPDQNIFDISLALILAWSSGRAKATRRSGTGSSRVQACELKSNRTASLDGIIDSKGARGLLGTFRGSSELSEGRTVGSRAHPPIVGPSQLLVARLTPPALARATSLISHLQSMGDQMRILTAAAVLVSLLVCDPALAQSGVPADLPAAATIEGGAVGPSLADRQPPPDPEADRAREMKNCMSAWDKGTHMSKAEWQRTCMHPVL
jgi:hypothetical protein